MVPLTFELGHKKMIAKDAGKKLPFPESPLIMVPASGYIH